MKSISKIKDYHKFFNDMYPKLCVFAYRLIGCSDTSKDIVQDVFIKVWEDKTEFQDNNHVTGYFYKSVKNKCLNHLKWKRFCEILKTELYDLTEIEDPSDEWILSEAIVIETTVIIENAIQTLPRKAAKVIRLSMKSHSNDEIANMMSISINTVKDHKKVAYSKLRNLLGDLVSGGMF